MSLFIRLSDSDLCFARYEAGTPTDFDFATFHLAPQASLTLNLRGAMQQVGLLQHDFDRVEVLAGSAVTPVPLADFQEEDAAPFYQFCFEPEARHRVFYDTVPSVNAVFLFALPESVCHALEETFGEGRVRYTAALTPVVQTFAGKGLGTSESRRIFVYVHDDRAEIVVLEAGRLLMQNSFTVQSLTDISYYTFNMARHLAIDISSTPVFVAGPTLLRDPVVTEFQQYAAKVFPIHPAADFNRHIVATTDGVPYDLVCALLRRRV